MNNLSARQWHGLFEYIATCKTEKEIADMYNEINSVSYSRDRIVANMINPDLDLKGELALMVFDSLGNQPQAISENKIKIGDEIFDLDEIKRAKFVDAIKLADMKITQTIPSLITAFEREVGYPSIEDISQGQKVELSDQESYIAFNGVKNELVVITPENNVKPISEYMAEDKTTENIITGLLNEFSHENNLSLT